MEIGLNFNLKFIRECCVCTKEGVLCYFEKGWFWRVGFSMFVCFDSLQPSKHFLNHITTRHPGLKKYLESDQVSCSRTQHSEARIATHLSSV